MPNVENMIVSFQTLLDSYIRSFPLSDFYLYVLYVCMRRHQDLPTMCFSIAATLIEIHLFSKGTLSASVFLFEFSFVFVELVLKLSWSLYRPSSQLALRLICIPTLQLNVSSKQIQTNSAAAHTHLRKTQQKNEEKVGSSFDSPIKAQDVLSAELLGRNF